MLVQEHNIKTEVKRKKNSFVRESMENIKRKKRRTYAGRTEQCTDSPAEDWIQGWDGMKSGRQIKCQLIFAILIVVSKDFL
jgi:hypothetical protein